MSTLKSLSSFSLTMRRVRVLRSSLEQIVFTYSTSFSFMPPLVRGSSAESSSSALAFLAFFAAGLVFLVSFSSSSSSSDSSSLSSSFFFLDAFFWGFDVVGVAFFVPEELLRFLLPATALPLVAMSVLGFFRNEIRRSESSFCVPERSRWRQPSMPFRSTMVRLLILPHQFSSCFWSSKTMPLKLSRFSLSSLGGKVFLKMSWDSIFRWSFLSALLMVWFLMESMTVGMSLRALPFPCCRIFSTMSTLSLLVDSGWKCSSDFLCRFAPVSMFQ
mmetsp:Transcript_58851/g.144308  ORF Transcript_58851/g.144308 Transcript_58851/m.144308 type:complete len:273 (-) Transcript_58851:40-858(-)